MQKALVQWLSGLFEFLWESLYRWGNLVTGGTIIGGLWVYESAFGQPVSAQFKQGLAVVFLGLAAFAAWSDERRKYDAAVAGSSHAALLRKCAESLRAGVYPMHALMQSDADQLNSNRDLVKLCDDLASRGFEHPFQRVAVIGGPFGPIKDKWLNFLKESRYRGYTLKNVAEVARVRAELLDADFTLWNTSPHITTQPTPFPDKTSVQLLDRAERIALFVRRYSEQEKASRSQRWDPCLLRLAGDADITSLQDDEEVREAFGLLVTSGISLPFKESDFTRGILAFYRTHLRPGFSIGGPAVWNQLYSEWFDGRHEEKLE